MTSEALPLNVLPPDYYQVLSHELIRFMHTFYRFGDSSTTFDLNDSNYQDLFTNIMFSSMLLGTIVFIMLLIIVVRRCFLHVPSAAGSFLYSNMETHALELTAAFFLTWLAITSLFGLMGSAQVDYAVGTAVETMTNTSNWFQSMQRFANDSESQSQSIRLLTDQFLVAFNESELPKESFQLSVDALRLVHASKELVSKGLVELPSNYSDIANEWDISYFLLKITTNTGILAVTVASFLVIASTGWSFVSSLRWSILILLAMVPISHVLVGVYLSSAIMTSDYCTAPMNSTMTLLHDGMTPTVKFYLDCPIDNQTMWVETNEASQSPLIPFVHTVDVNLDNVLKLQEKLEIYAQQHSGPVGLRMKKEFLDPIGSQLQAVKEALENLKGMATNCTPLKHGLTHAVTEFCEYGMLGFFSMWVHQLVLCLLLFVGVVVSAIVFERVYMRETGRPIMRYQSVLTTDDIDRNGDENRDAYGYTAYPGY